MEEEVKAKRYVVYLRKSEDDPQKQVRSIEDQRAECLEVAERLNIDVKKSDIIIDERSAKKADNRPGFNTMIKDIKKGKVDGIIAWHPDRLARNMKEAGEIIDLLDEGYLVDLRFAAHAFTNDYNGKMALGIAFVLAKQYTDKLATDVKRGLRRALLEGKSAGTYKPGYIRSTHTGLYEPDETLAASGSTMFSLMRRAWEMRIEGNTLEEISTYLNDNGFKRILKNKAEQTMSREKMRRVFSDSLYYGVLKQGGEEINLMEISDFTPIIDEAEYFLVQKYNRPELSGPHHHNYPFKTVLKCAKCGKNLTVGAPKGRGGDRYLRYWCGTKDCNKTSIRALKIIDFASDIYNSLQINEKYYDDYVSAAKSAVLKNRKLLFSQQALLSKRRHKAELDLENAILQRSDDDTETRAIERIKQKQKDIIEDCTIKIAEIEQQLERIQAKDVEEFLNTLKSLSERFKSASASTKDEILQNSFLNIAIEDGKIATYKLKEPFATMLKSSPVKDGGPGWT